MKVTVDEKKGDDIKYPCLMIADDGDIVFLTKKSCGILFKRGEGSRYKVGYPSESWQMELFKPFTGSITLESD